MIFTLSYNRSEIIKSYYKYLKLSPNLYNQKYMYFDHLQYPKSEKCIFSAILEELEMEEDKCSIEAHIQEENYQMQDEAVKNQKQQQTGSNWYWHEEDLPINYLSQKCIDQFEDVNGEIRKVKSKRQQQEEKIFLFLKQSEQKEIQKMQDVKPNSPKKSRNTMSLSPKKTKLIDKHKALRLTVNQVE